MGILDGDGALSYGWEKNVETYYDFKVIKGVDFTLDYQFVADPAFNRARGPVSILRRSASLAILMPDAPWLSHK